MSDEETTYRKTLCGLTEDFSAALELTSATLGMQSHYDRAVTHVAKQLGVQSRDMFIIGEYRVNKDGKDEFLRAFAGLRDPNPDPDLRGKLLSFKEALEAEWQPAR